MSVKCKPPLTPFLYRKTGVFRGILVFLFLIRNMHCGCSLDPPRRGGSNVHPRCVFWQKFERYRFFFFCFNLYSRKESLYITWECLRYELKLKVCVFIFSKEVNKSELLFVFFHFVFCNFSL